MKFPAEIYAQFRPMYPPQTYVVLRQWMDEARVGRPAVIADIGCGAGHFTLGLAQSGLAGELLAIEPDPEMLDHVRHQPKIRASKATFIERPAEATGLLDESVDVVTCASAFHWMDRERAVAEFMRIIRRPGLLFFCEYSFPRSQSHSEFDHWIREKLRGEWQIPQLLDREPFESMVSVFGTQAGVRDLGSKKVEMVQELGWEDLAGLIRSQSRYAQRWSSLGTDREREELDRMVEEKAHELLGDDLDHFDFGLRAAGFAVTPR